MRRILAVLGAALLLTGCAARPPRFVPAKPLDRGIEKFDFGNARWQTGAGAITLHGGHAPEPGSIDGGTVDISSGPYFSDVDGDHDEDAAVELHSGGQGFTLAWYVWLWQDGTAKQLTTPFSDQPRCGGHVDSVKPVPGGFRVRERLFSPASSCAEGGTVPVTYTLGMRDGFLVQTAPTLGPVPICNAAFYTMPVTLDGPVTPRAAASDEAPAIATDVRYERASAWGATSPEDGWVMLLLDDGDHSPFCGYVPADAVR